jgi:hypothetical protein
MLMSGRGPVFKLEHSVAWQGGCVRSLSGSTLDACFLSKIESMRYGALDHFFPAAEARLGKCMRHEGI